MGHVVQPRSKPVRPKHHPPVGPVIPGILGIVHMPRLPARAIRTVFAAGRSFSQEPHKEFRLPPNILWFPTKRGTIDTPRSGSSMKFERTYSALDNVYAGVDFSPRTSRIVNPGGSVIFEAKDVMVPTGWSQVAVDVLAQKYCRKAGVPSATQRVPEEGVPEWLWRSIPDEAALNG